MWRSRSCFVFPGAALARSASRAGSVRPPSSLLRPRASRRPAPPARRPGATARSSSSPARPHPAHGAQLRGASPRGARDERRRARFARRPRSTVRAPPPWEELRRPLEIPSFPWAQRCDLLPPVPRAALVPNASQNPEPLDAPSTANQRSRSSSPGTGSFCGRVRPEHLRRAANRGLPAADRAGLALSEHF